MGESEQPTLDDVEISNYGSIVQAAVKLTRLHAFIGPNDSGKSTLLRAIENLVRAWTFAREHMQWLPPDEPGATLLGKASTFSFSTRSSPRTVVVQGPNGSAEIPGRRTFTPETLPMMMPPWRGAQIVRLDPDALRRPSNLVPEGTSLGFLSSRGEGLPGIYQAILSRGDDTFHRLSDDVRRLFPTVRALRVPAISHDRLALEVMLSNGTRVQADRMSEGLLYFLAFAALPYLTPTSMLLVEEPENGLHPARIAEVIRMLRAMAEGGGPQIILATHSPLVVNELRPEEVSIVTRPSTEAGTQVTRMIDTPNFEKRASVYQLGELWLSYADGVLEAPLLEGKT